MFFILELNQIAFQRTITWSKNLNLLTFFLGVLHIKYGFQLIAKVKFSPRRGEVF